VLDGWIIGQSPTTPIEITTSLFDDIDPDTTLSFSANSCTLG